MKLIRTSVVTLVAVAVLAMAVPAQARGFEKPQPAVQSQSGGWLDLAVTWLTRLTGTEPAPSSRMMKSTTPPPTTTGGSGPHYTPMTGPCIDPLGVGRCNV